MNGIAAAVVADDDNGIDNAKLSLGCKNLIEDLDGFRDKYYQVKGKCGLIYDRNDDINPPPLPPESPTYTMNIPCIHSSIPNNEERIVIPSSVSRVAKNDTMMKEDEDSREELDIYQKEIDEISSIYTAILKEKYENQLRLFLKKNP